jgi:hypothetical protein
MQLVLVDTDGPILRRVDELQKRAKTPPDNHDPGVLGEGEAALLARIDELHELQQELPGLVRAIRSGNYLSG